MIFIALQFKNMNLPNPIRKSQSVLKKNVLKSLGESGAFAKSEFQNLAKKKLTIPVKLFHL